MGKVALIANARSHLVAVKGSRLEEVARQHRGVPLVWFDTLPAFNAALQDLLKSGHDSFIVEGGDGTVLATLTGCYNSDPQAFAGLHFAILPGGSTNLAHEKLGLKQPAIARIRALIAALETDNAPAAVTQQRALIVEQDGLSAAQLGFLLSTGSLASGMDHVQHHMFSEGSRGTLAIARALLTLAARPSQYTAADGKPLLRPSHFEPHTSGLPVEAGPHAFSLASTFSSLSLGISPFWGEGDGPIHFTWAPWPPEKLRRAILYAATGRNRQSLEKAGYRSIDTRTLSMTVDGPVMLDGELLRLDPASPLRVRSSGAIRFLR
jgi:hypothetical protein